MNNKSKKQERLDKIYIDALEKLAQNDPELRLRLYLHKKGYEVKIK